MFHVYGLQKWLLPPCSKCGARRFLSSRQSAPYLPTCAVIKQHPHLCRSCSTTLHQAILRKCPYCRRKYRGNDCLECTESKPTPCHECAILCYCTEQCRKHQWCQTCSHGSLQRCCYCHCLSTCEEAEVALQLDRLALVDSDEIEMANTDHCVISAPMRVAVDGLNLRQVHARCNEVRSTVGLTTTEPTMTCRDSDSVSSSGRGSVSGSGSIGGSGSGSTSGGGVSGGGSGSSSDTNCTTSTGIGGNNDINCRTNQHQ